MTTPTIDEQLLALEAEAERVGPGTAAQLLNRAGDLCLSTGMRDRAIRYYGRAIDANLFAQRYEAAIGVCHKVLSVAPTAVRTRCTLAWLALGKGDLEETVREVGAYVTAADAADERPRAARHLLLMSQSTDDARVRELVAAHLDRLGAREEAAHVRAEVGTPAFPAAASSADRHEARWRKVVDAALAGPHDL
jgi:tetratricopeptide (TPR) repeat protein